MGLLYTNMHCFVFSGFDFEHFIRGGLTLVELKSIICCFIFEVFPICEARDQEWWVCVVGHECRYSQRFQRPLAV